MIINFFPFTPKSNFIRIWFVTNVAGLLSRNHQNVTKFEAKAQESDSLSSTNISFENHQIIFVFHSFNLCVLKSNSFFKSPVRSNSLSQTVILDLMAGPISFLSSAHEMRTVFSLAAFGIDLSHWPPANWTMSAMEISIKDTKRSQEVYFVPLSWLGGGTTDFVAKTL